MYIYIMWLSKEVERERYNKISNLFNDFVDSILANVNINFIY